MWRVELFCFAFGIMCLAGYQIDHAHSPPLGCVGMEHCCNIQQYCYVCCIPTSKPWALVLQQYFAYSRYCCMICNSQLGVLPRGLLVVMILFILSSGGAILLCMYFIWYAFACYSSTPYLGERLSYSYPIPSPVHYFLHLFIHGGFRDWLLAATASFIRYLPQYISTPLDR